MVVEDYKEWKDLYRWEWDDEFLEARTKSITSLPTKPIVLEYNLISDSSAEIWNTDGTFHHNITINVELYCKMDRLTTQTPL